MNVVKAREVMQKAQFPQQHGDSSGMMKEALDLLLKSAAKLNMQQLRFFADAFNKLGMTEYSIHLCLSCGAKAEPEKDGANGYMAQQRVRIPG